MVVFVLLAVVLHIRNDLIRQETKSANALSQIEAESAPQTSSMPVDTKNVSISMKRTASDKEPNLKVRNGVDLDKKVIVENVRIFVTGIGPHSTLRITDVSGSLPASGASIVINAWDVNGTAIPESDSAVPLKLNSGSTITLTGTALHAGRFPTATPVTYKFTIESAKVLVKKTQVNADGTRSDEKSTICSSGAECAI